MTDADIEKASKDWRYKNTEAKQPNDCIADDAFKAGVAWRDANPKEAFIELTGESAKKHAEAIKSFFNQSPDFKDPRQEVVREICGWIKDEDFENCGHYANEIQKRFGNSQP